MTPAAFTYHAPRSVDEVLQLLAGHGAGARLLAGGQSLIPLMKLRQRRPADVIDLNGLSELEFLRFDGRVLRIGAMTRHDAFCTGARLPTLGLPAGFARFLARLAGHIGTLSIRSRGTVGGSLAQAEPHAEWLLALVLLDGRVAISGAQGTRTLDADGFLHGPHRTALAPFDLITEARIPVPDRHSRYGFHQTRLRPATPALSSAAVLLERADGRIRQIRAALSGEALMPLRLTDLEERLRGRRTADISAAEVAALARAACAAICDEKSAFRQHIHATTLAASLSQVLGAGDD